MRKLEKVCVYCASSQQANSEYAQAAFQLGEIFAQNEITVVNGGGAVGLMGALADGAIAAGGKVVGIIPQFMVDLEWAHPNISELIIVETMHERKEQMIQGVDAVVALPGGSGTFEELFEAITWKRLGLYVNPIILLNTKNYFEPCLNLLSNCVKEKFMDERHRDIWAVAETPNEVIPAILKAPAWSVHARQFAALH